MKRAILWILVVSILATFSFASHADSTSADGESLTLKGTIIDNMCADGSKDNLAEFVKTHTKQCALMEHCVASGFSIYTDGELHKFDEASNKKIADFLKKSENKLMVVVDAERSDKGLSLISIKNQK